MLSLKQLLVAENAMSQKDLCLADWSLVPDILKVLKTDFPDSLPAYRYLHLFAKWRNEQGNNLNAILLTPGGKVNEYGTFAYYIGSLNYAVFHSLNHDNEEMKSLLLKSKDIPWDKEFISVLDEIYSTWNMKRSSPDFKGSAYLMDLDEAKKIKYTCPPNFYLGPIKEEQGEFIDSFWPHRNSNASHSVDITKFIIGKNGGIGLYSKESNELLAWCLIWLQNGPGQLYVLDEHKRKGYGTLLAGALTKSLAEKGIEPLVFISENNIASQKMFEKIGYKKLYKVQWSSARPRTD